MQTPSPPGKGTADAGTETLAVDRQNSNTQSAIRQTDRDLLHQAAERRRIQFLTDLLPPVTEREMLRLVANWLAQARGVAS